MAFFEWKDEYSVKVAELDAQHRKLVELINKFYESFKEGGASDAVGNAIEGLVQYSKMHFRQEEDLMRQYKYPELEAQQAAHDAFVKKVEDLLKRHSEGKLVLASEVGTFMRTWLSEHILKADKKYSATFSAAGLS